MGSTRENKAESLIVELAAKYIAREAGRSTLITPMRADISPDRKNATIYVSVFPDAESDHALAFLKRHKDLFRNSMKGTTRLAVLPYITFELDYGERNRQHLEEITRGLVIPEAREEDSTEEA
ncbi:MAG: Ribosome-binding factor A [Parcubacteria bacterium C7867-008]|nr:MAG: Ribosome-binding factor A [Parcubacteria bacterium C7867-008]